MINDYEKCIRRKIIGDRLQIECVLGLWEVESSSIEDCEKEARHYWNQYMLDGEYSSIIGGESVKEVLKKTLGKGE